MRILIRSDLSRSSDEAILEAVRRGPCLVVVHVSRVMMMLASVAANMGAALALLRVGRPFATG